MRGPTHNKSKRTSETYSWFCSTGAAEDGRAPTEELFLCLVKRLLFGGGHQEQGSVQVSIACRSGRVRVLLWLCLGPKALFSKDEIDPNHIRCLIMRLLNPKSPVENLMR